MFDFQQPVRNCDGLLAHPESVGVQQVYQSFTEQPLIDEHGDECENKTKKLRTEKIKTARVKLAHKAGYEFPSQCVRL